LGDTFGLIYLLINLLLRLLKIHDNNVQKYIDEVDTAVLPLLPIPPMILPVILSLTPLPTPPLILPPTAINL
jgi:hypothetical protein